MTKIADLEKIVDTNTIPQSWKHHMAYALDTIPSQDISFLQDDYLLKVKKRIRITEPNIASIKEAIHVIRENPHLRFLSWLWHCILFCKKADTINEVLDWPLPLQPVKMTGHLATMFPVVIILSGYDSVLIDYKKLGNVPEHIIDDTLTSVNDAMNRFRENNDDNGLTMSNFNRLLTHFRCTLFRIGRFEYDITTLNNPITVFRNTSTGKEVVFSEPNIRYRHDVHVDGTNNIYADVGEAWVATFVKTNTSITGNPMRPDGYADKKTLTLNKQEWTRVLEKGDNILAIHIPREGALTKALCQKSIHQAAHFFKTFFPDQNFKAFVCITWMLDPQLDLLLDASSNILMFQRQFTLYPVLSVDRTIYKFVYNVEQTCPIKELPEKTSLQRDIKTYMLAGGHMHTGGGFITL